MVNWTPATATKRSGQQGSWSSAGSKLFWASEGKVTSQLALSAAFPLVDLMRKYLQK